MNRGADVTRFSDVLAPSQLTSKSNTETQPNSVFLRALHRARCASRSRGCMWIIARGNELLINSEQQLVSDGGAHVSGRLLFMGTLRKSNAECRCGPRRTPPPSRARPRNLNNFLLLWRGGGRERRDRRRLAVGNRSRSLCLFRPQVALIKNVPTGCPPRFNFNNFIKCRGAAHLIGKVLRQLWKSFLNIKAVPRVGDCY